MALKDRSESRHKSRASIPTASMGDIAFLIIIFFMTTSVFSREKGLKILLPEKGEEVKVKSENILEVRVSGGGQVLVGKESTTPVEILEVREQVVRMLADNPKLSIALKVSRRAPYRVMVEVFDQLKLANATRISLVPVEDVGGG